MNTTTYGVPLNTDSDVTTADASVSDSFQSIISYSTMYNIETVVQVGTLPAMTLCGVTFNVINMAVFLRQGLSDRINLCLFSLALSDTGYLLSIMISKFYGILYLVSTTLGNYWKAQGLLLVSLYAGFQTASNCLTLVISLERCLCVLWPLKARTLISVRKIQCVISLIFLFCFSTNILFFFKFDVIEYQDPVSQSARYKIKATTFYRTYKQTVDVIFENVNIYLPSVSLIVVMAATTVIAVRMRSVLEWRQETVSVSQSAPSANERREVSMTRMLVVVCSIYTVCTLPYVVHALIRFVTTDFRPDGKYKNIFFATAAIMHVILCINCSANFVVYYTMSTRFKNTLTELRKKIARKEPSK